MVGKVVILNRSRVKHLDVPEADLLQEEFLAEEALGGNAVALLKAVRVDHLEVGVGHPAELLDELCGYLVLGVQYALGDLDDHALVHRAPDLIHRLTVVAVEVKLEIGRVQVVVLSELREVCLVVDESADEDPLDFTGSFEARLVLSLEEEHLSRLKLLEHQLPIVAKEDSLVVGVGKVGVHELEMQVDGLRARNLYQLHAHELDGLILKRAPASVHAWLEAVSEELLVVHLVRFGDLFPEQDVFLVPVAMEHRLVSIEGVTCVAFEVELIVEGEAALDLGGD